MRAFRVALLGLLLSAGCAGREEAPRPQTEVEPVTAAGPAVARPRPTEPASDEPEPSRPHVLVTAAGLGRLEARRAQCDRLRRVVAASREAPESADELYLTVVNRGLARHLFDDSAQIAPLQRLIDAAREGLARHGTKSLETTIDFDIPATVLALALAYDFSHGDLSAPHREAIATDLDEWGRRLVVAMRGEGPWATDFGNHKTVLLHAAGVAGASLYPDPAGARLLEECEREYRDRVAPALDVAGGEDGGWPEGISYNRKTAMSVIGFAEAVEHATGRDPWNVSSWLSHNGDYIAYQLRPDGRFLAVGDVTSDAPTVIDRLILGRLGAVFGRAQDARLANSLPRLDAYRDEPLFAGLDLAYVDPDPPPAGAPERPPSKAFRGIGLTVLREGRGTWGGATVVTFRSGDTISAHQHADQNAFTIFRTAPLAIDSGVYDDYWSVHSFQYYRRTIAHNTFVVFDPEETFPAPKRLARAGTPRLANDGGQDLFGAVPKSMDDYEAHRDLLDTGDLQAFVSQEDYDYVRGDATHAYSSAKLTRFVREMLLLHRTRRDGNTILLVVDRLDLARPGLRAAWLLHTVERPDVQAGRALVRNGDAEMTVAPLDPDCAIEVVGGKGREFLVDGTNYPPERIRKTAPPAGAWRLEIVPPGREREIRMVTALVVGRNTAADADAIRLSAVGDLRVITLPGDGAAGSVVLGREGAYEVTLAARAPSGSVLRVTTEDVTIWKRTGQDATVRDDGTVRVSLRGPGPHRVWLRSPGSGG
ncbi:heparinase II/III-family protein [bacterium]|nr:heparinase II/III-family protein [bacterium]